MVKNARGSEIPWTVGSFPGIRGGFTTVLNTAPLPWSRSLVLKMNSVSTSNPVVSKT